MLIIASTFLLVLKLFSVLSLDRAGDDNDVVLCHAMAGVTQECDKSCIKLARPALTRIREE